MATPLGESTAPDQPVPCDSARSLRRSLHGKQRIQRNERPPSKGRLCRQIRHESFVAVADNRVDALEGSNLAGGPLGVAARHHNAGVGIFALHTADEGARRAVGLRGHATRVDDNDIGLRRPCRRHEAAPAKLRGNRLSVGPAGPTTEILNVVFCHHSPVYQ